MKRLAKILLPLLLAGGLFAACQPNTMWHYAANGNFTGNTYTPGADKFNLADVSSLSTLSILPAGVEGLVYVGTCNGVDSTFQNTVDPFINNSKVFGFYLMDEPDPTGLYGPLCTAANLKAESDWIHYFSNHNDKTFIIMMNLGPSSAPTYSANGVGYTPANTDLDYVGLDPYPCRSELNGGAGGCEYNIIDLAVTAAENQGWPQADLVPVYQYFGGGTWTDDGGGQWILPTPAEETNILNEWGPLVPSPAFDYAYSWGTQRSDQSLQGSDLEPIATAHN